jgi:hypothetical protein
MWHTLHDIQSLWPQELCDVPTALQKRAIESAQHMVSGHMADEACMQLLAGCNIDTDAGRAAAARWRSCACREAAAYLDAFPAKPLLLSDAELRTGLRLHLGVLQLPVAAISTQLVRPTPH